jgi:hypothetical protein
MKKLMCAVSLWMAFFSFANASNVNTVNSNSMSKENNQTQTIITENHALTRQEVYNQLVQAEKDGTLKHLNDTVYKGN